MNPFAVISLCVGISCSILAAIAIIYGRTKTHGILAFFNIAVAMWGFGLFMAGNARTAQAALFYWKLAHISAVFIAVLFFHLVCIFCGIKRRALLAFGYAQAVFFNWLNLVSDRLFTNIRYVYNLYFVDINPLFSAALLMYLFFVALSYFELNRFLKSVRGAKRLQTLYIYFGFLLGFSGGTTIFLPGFKIDILYPFGHCTIPIYTIVITYAILKYKVMDISLAIKRTVIYGLIYSFSVGVFAFLTIVIGQWLMYGHMESKFYLLSMLSILIIVFSLRPLDNLLTNLTDKYLFRKKYEYQKTLKKASQGMTRIQSLPKLLNLITRMTVYTVRISYAAVYLLDKEKGVYVATAVKRARKSTKITTGTVSNRLTLWLQTNKRALVYDEIKDREDLAQEMLALNASVCIPSLIEDKMIGFLMLGDKLSGDIYTQEDIDLFSTLANQAALAIENAESYEELKDTRDQLVQSEKLAAIGKFANEVAHEIKNPLQVIKTFVEFLPEKYQEAEFRDKFTRITNTELARIDSFIKQLAFFSKPAQMELAPVAIHQLLDSTLILLENDFRKKNTQIARNYVKNDVNILADRNQLKQVLLNLFLNSLQAMETDRPNQLTVETQLYDSSLLIKLSDSGCGIPEQNIPRIFDPFFSTKQTGSGLGLTIVKGIIENHKGKISAANHSAAGATFTITLPVGG